jgi:hypothetical protein
MEKSEEKPERLSHDDIEEIATRVVRRVFLEMGIDASTPLAAQQDFAFMRNLRRGFESTKRTARTTAVGIFVTTILTLLLWAIKQAIKGEMK